MTPERCHTCAPPPSIVRGGHDCFDSHPALNAAAPRARRPAPTQDSPHRSGRGDGMLQEFQEQCKASGGSGIPSMTSLRSRGCYRPTARPLPLALARCLGPPPPPAPSPSAVRVRMYSFRRLRFVFAVRFRETCKGGKEQSEGRPEKGGWRGREAAAGVCVLCPSVHVIRGPRRIYTSSLHLLPQFVSRPSADRPQRRYGTRPLVCTASMKHSWLRPAAASLDA